MVMTVVKWPTEEEDEMPKVGSAQVVGCGPVKEAPGSLRVPVVPPSGTCLAV